MEFLAVACGHSPTLCCVLSGGSVPGTPPKGQDHSPGGGRVAELGVLRVEKSRPEDGDPLPLFIPLTPAHLPFRRLWSKVTLLSHHF